MKRVKNMVDEDDKFNKLHDDQLRHIINLLPTKDALRTSVLSSRWKNLWRCISNIDLDVLSFESKQHEISFLESIDRLLVNHDSSDIKRFHFSSDHASPALTIGWISEVIKHNVEQLHISVYLNGDCTLPLCLFKSESLTVLELDMSKGSFYQSTNLGPTNSSLFPVHLPCLKRLKLSRVVFSNDHSTQHFFSNIPKLQHLCLYRCDWKKVNRLIIDIPTLEGIDVGIRDTCNLDCQVTVIAPNLTSLKCDTDFCIDFHLSNHSLPLNVLLKTYFLGDVHRDLPLTFLQSVKEATSLHMEWELKTNLWLSQKSIGVEDLPLFMNLKYLEISAQNYHSIGEVQLEKIFMFLHKMPYIESFAITVPEDRNTLYRHYKEDWSKGGVPSCVINQIKNITIITSEPLTRFPAAAKQVHYFSPAMDLIKYFMNHSQSLETLEIIWLCSSSRPTPDILDEIERHPRYSELKRFSCPPYIIPRPQSMPFPWENEDPNDMDLID